MYHLYMIIRTRKFCVCMNKPNCTANGRLGDGDIEDKTDVVKYLIMFRTWLAAMQEKLP